MKTGIITFHDTTNYGANLQAYSLFKAIKSLGYDCEIINYQCENIIRRSFYKYTWIAEKLYRFAYSIS